MRRLVTILLIATSAVASVHAADFRRLPVKEYRDKMKAGWLGQMAGVAWGAPTEFKWKGADHPRGQDARRGSPRRSTTASGRTTSTSR